MQTHDNQRLASHLLAQHLPICQTLLQPAPSKIHPKQHHGRWAHSSVVVINLCALSAQRVMLPPLSACCPAHLMRSSCTGTALQDTWRWPQELLTATESCNDHRIWQQPHSHHKLASSAAQKHRLQYADTTAVRHCGVTAGPQLAAVAACASARMPGSSWPWISCRLAPPPVLM